MTNSEITGAVSQLTVGDERAQQGNWSAAVQAWIATPDGPDKDISIGRLRWFFENQTNESRINRHRTRLTSLILATAGCALVGFALLFTNRSDSTLLLVVVIWALFIAAGAMAVITARTIGTNQIASLSSSELEQIIVSANSMDSGQTSDLGETNMRR